jgi:hypothetical protein
MTWHLGDVRSKLREQYVRFSSSVALDDSASPRAAAPLTFSVVTDDVVVWKSKALSAPGEFDTCNIAVKGVMLLRLCVETRHSGSARGVWLDPHLLADPLPPSIIDEISHLPPASDVQSKVRLARSKDGHSMRLLPSSAVFDESTV